MCYESIGQEIVDSSIDPGNMTPELIYQSPFLPFGKNGIAEPTSAFRHGQILEGPGWGDLTLDNRPLPGDKIWAAF